MPSVKIRIEKDEEQTSDAKLQKGLEDRKNKVSIESAFVHQMIGTGKQIVSYSASNIGNFTGNFIEQDRVNQNLEILSDMATITLGFASKGVLGGAVAIAGITTKKIFQAISDYRKDILMERDRAYMLARSGNSTKNGSRGTEN